MIRICEPSHSRGRVCDLFVAAGLGLLFNEGFPNWQSLWTGDVLYLAGNIGKSRAAAGLV